MTAQQILAWAVAHPELAVVAAGALLSIPGAVYAVVKTAFQAITGRAAKGPVWTTLDVIAEVLPNLPGAINRAVRGAGLPSIFAPPSAPTPPSNGQSGRAQLGALVVLLVVGLGAGAVTNGCDPIREGVMRVTPGVPEPSVCVPDSHRCAGAVPEVCSQSSMGNTRWWPSLSLRADGTQRVCSNGCVVDDAGIAGCASPIPGNPFADASVTEGGAL